MKFSFQALKGFCSRILGKQSIERLRLTRTYTLLYLKQITNKDLLFKKIKNFKKEIKKKECLGTTGNEEL